MKSLDTKFAPEHGNAIELLRYEHNCIWQLCEHYRAGLEQNPPRDRIKVAQELCHMMAMCSLIEQEILYPAARTIDEELVLDLLQGHDKINACITEIWTLTPDDMDFDLEVLRLIDIVQMHIHESERMLFPLIKVAIPEHRMQLLVADFVRRSLLLRIMAKGDLMQRAQGQIATMPLIAARAGSISGHRAAAERHPAH